jgi:uncharacterized protein (UPF0332 family)
MNEEIRDLLGKSAQSRDAALLLLHDGYVDFAASRAYYAMFYAIEGLLLSRNLSFSKHSAVISAFGKEFIKTGLLDIRFHRSIMNAFDLRNSGDYGSMHAVSEENAQGIIYDAGALLEAVQQFLSDISEKDYN